jgi:eukaryotic-like serine/threonine-protein kinase
MIEGKHDIILVMAHFFAALLALFQPEPPPAAPPLDARWSVTFATTPAATPGYDATSAYIPLKGGQLVAVDLERGTTRWTLDHTTTFRPATGEGLVFTVGDQMGDQIIEALDGATGATRWRSPLPGGAAAALYYDTGWLLASTTGGNLVALRAADGAVLWQRQLGAPLSGPPGPALDRLYLALADHRLVSVLLNNGDTIWERTMPSPVTSMLALEDQLLVGTAANRFVSVDLQNGRERWGWNVGGDISGLPVADDKRIYFAARDNILRALDRRSGNLRWKANLPSRPAGGPLRGQIALLMPMVSSEIAGFDPETGKPIVSVRAAGEIGTQPFVRTGAGATSPVLVTVSREGQLQGFGRRFEPVPQLLQLPLIGAPALP